MSKFSLLLDENMLIPSATDSIFPSMQILLQVFPKILQPQLSKLYQWWEIDLPLTWIIQGMDAYLKPEFWLSSQDMC